MSTKVIVVCITLFLGSCWFKEEIIDRKEERSLKLGEEFFLGIILGKFVGLGEEDSINWIGCKQIYM